MYERENDNMLRWLSDKSPDMRHYVATNLNRDFAEPTLDWIVARDDCHLATAVELFWLSHDSDLIRYPNRQAAREDYSLWAFDFIEGIVSRATAGFYKNNLISYNLGEGRDFQIKEYSEYEEQYRGQGLPWIAPVSFRVRHQMLNIDTTSVETGFWSPKLNQLMRDLGHYWNIETCLDENEG